MGSLKVIRVTLFLRVFARGLSVETSAQIVEVTRADQLNEVAAALSSAEEIAVDVEADSMHHFRARLCFVQIAHGEQIFLLDTLAPEVRASALQTIFHQPHVTKYFHAASGDLQYLCEEGVRVHGLFDTHRAATLLGWPKVGLADLVKEKCAAQLKKEHQQADFSVRPLPGALREYIADDVRYLVEVGRWVKEACLKADILEEVLLDCDRLCDEAAHRPDVATSYEPTLPRQGLSSSQVTLAHHVAQALHGLRLKWAEAEDVPMGRMLSNRAIGELATKIPDSLRGMAKLEGVRGPFVRAHGEEVMALIHSLKAEVAAGALASVDDKKGRNPQKKKRENALLEWRKAEAEKRKVTPSVVLSNALVSDLASAAPHSAQSLAAVPYLGEKRLARYGDQLLSLLRDLC